MSFELPLLDFDLRLRRRDDIVDRCLARYVAVAVAYGFDPDAVTERVASDNEFHLEVRPWQRPGLLRAGARDVVDELRGRARRLVSRTPWTAAQERWAKTPLDTARDGFDRS